MSDQSVKRWKPSQCAVFASGDMEFIEASDHDRIVAFWGDLADKRYREMTSCQEIIAQQRRVIDKIKAALNDDTLYSGLVCVAIRDAIERGEK